MKKNKNGVIVVFVIIIILIIVGVIISNMDDSNMLKEAKDVGLTANDNYLIGVSLLDNKEQVTDYIDSEVKFYDLNGDEIYLIVPKYKDTTVKIYESELTDDGNLEKANLVDTLSEPFIIKCNISDIVPSVILKITHEDRVEEYSPFISLKDGSLVTSDFVYNFTK